MAFSTLSVDLVNALKDSPGGFENVNIKNGRDSMKISLHRTIRVPDDGTNYQLPPDLGKFPIFSIDDFAEKLPVDIVRKGGVFVPIWQREALWIRFHANASAQFAVKVFVGGINAVSGESKQNAPDSKEPNAEMEKKQNYLVVPGQEWLDGIVRSDGTVMQFVSEPTGSGYSVEAQITGVDKISGLQFEIIPSRVLPHSDGNTTVRSLSGQYFNVHANSDMTIGELKDRIKAIEGTPQVQQRLSFNSRILNDHHTLRDYNVTEGVTVHMIVRLSGGTKLSSRVMKQMRKEVGKKAKEQYDREYELTLAPGGSIRQAIRKDVLDIGRYDEKNAIMFNVQFLAPKTFQLVTGTPPAQTPISAKTYAKHGYPFFEMYNESREITGTFGELLKSVGDIDKEKNVNLEVHQREKDSHFRSVKLNTVDEMSDFHSELVIRKKNAQQ